MAWLSWPLGAFGLIGMYIVGRRNVWGWAWALFGQFLWLLYEIATQQYGFILSTVVYLGVYAKNLRSWLREKEVKR